MNEDIACTGFDSEPRNVTLGDQEILVISALRKGGRVTYETLRDLGLPNPSSTVAVLRSKGFVITTGPRRTGGGYTLVSEGNPTSFTENLTPKRFPFEPGTPYRNPATSKFFLAVSDRELVTLQGGVYRLVTPYGARYLRVTMSVQDLCARWGVTEQDLDREITARHFSPLPEGKMKTCPRGQKMKKGTVEWVEENQIARSFRVSPMNSRRGGPRVAQ